MSIKIEIDAATGAEARLELLNLLGVTGALVAKPLTEEQKETFKTEFKAATEEQITAQEPEPTKAKRRTKAEIEAEKKAAESAQATETADETEQPAAEETKAEYPTLQDLQRVCAILVRAGYKQQGIDFIKNVGGADTSKDVAEDKRQACIDAMTKFAEENKISL